MRTIIALAMVLTASVANAQQREEYGTMGFGARTCGEFAQHYKNTALIEDDYFILAQGFMSGINACLYWGVSYFRDNFQIRDLNAKTIEEQKRVIRLYCNDHPLADYKEGVVSLWQSLPAMTAR